LPLFSGFVVGGSPGPVATASERPGRCDTIANATAPAPPQAKNMIPTTPQVIQGSIDRRGAACAAVTAAAWVDRTPVREDDDEPVLGA
jgi:hypothetical protein